METFETKSVAGTLALGRKLARRLQRGHCICLVGDLGAGKTVLIRGIAQGLGLKDNRLVSSPTFVLVQEYPLAIPMFHLDLYRMSEAEEELADLGIEEMLRQGIVLIEWADKADTALPRARWDIRIEITGAKSRRFCISRSEQNNFE